MTMAIEDRATTTRLLCIFGALAALTASGCSRGFDNAPVDASLARETLQAAMESWKKGEKVDALQNASPPIYVIDMEWQGGSILKDYEIVGPGEEKDAHLMCRVKLTVRAPRALERKPEGKQTFHHQQPGAQSYGQSEGFLRLRLLPLAVQREYSSRSARHESEDGVVDFLAASECTRVAVDGHTHFSRRAFGFRQMSPRREIPSHSR